MKYLLLTFLLLVTCYLLLGTPVRADVAACKQACDDRLQQCEKDDCINRPPGKSHDNCINDCVQAKDRCVAVCQGKKPPTTCRQPSQAIMDTPSMETQGGDKVSANFSWHGGDEGTQGGCDGTGRKFIITLGTCPKDLKDYDPNLCSGPIFTSDLLTEATLNHDLTLNQNYWWQVHTICNCGADSLSPLQVFVANPFACNSKASEELAVCNINNGTLPIEVAHYSPPRNIFQQIKDILNTIVATLLFQLPGNSARMYDQSGSLDQVSVPSQVKPQQDVIQNFKGYLGEKQGIYCVELPDQLKASDTNDSAIKKCELTYEKSNFPDCIHPITPGDPNSTNPNCPATGGIQPTTGGGPPSTSDNSACKQACFNTLDQCQNDGCRNRTPGKDHDNCVNECVISKDKCLKAC